MIRFLFKGILRDKSRSLLPIIIVSIGVMLTVFLSGYLRGMMSDVVSQNARFDTGHAKVITKAYLENKDQLPIDLALLDIGELTDELNQSYPDYEWILRTRFGGLVDVPDAEGNTTSQGPASGIALDLLSPGSSEIERMNLRESIREGQLPTKPGQALIGAEFASKLEVKVGDNFTFMGTTMNGSMSFQNFEISGTVSFGIPAMDIGAILIDITDAQGMLDMYDGSAELLAFAKNDVFNDEEVATMVNDFNGKHDTSDEFEPIMLSIREQNNLASMIDYSNAAAAIFVAIFVFAMSIVLWNTGLLGGLRRYYEFGIRLALGESKGAIYRSLIMEASLIGIIGSIVGTIIGVGATYYLQVNGIDISQFTENSGIMMPSKISATVTADLMYIGFIPGVLAMVIGNMLSGIGIYKRETATLFKELEV